MARNRIKAYGKAGGRAAVSPRGESANLVPRVAARGEALSGKRAPVAPEMEMNRILASILVFTLALPAASALATTASDYVRGNGPGYLRVTAPNGAVFASPIVTFASCWTGSACLPEAKPSPGMTANGVWRVEFVLDAVQHAQAFYRIGWQIGGKTGQSSWDVCLAPYMTYEIRVTETSASLVAQRCAGLYST